MCRNDTRGVCLVLALVSSCAVVLGQSSGIPEWRKLGNSSVDLMLASAATGPVENVWFSTDGSRLFARTRSGKTFETADFENWTPVPFGLQPPAPSGVFQAVERVPASDVQLRQHPSNPGRVYALGAHLYQSDDGGRSWINLTAYNGQSIIGSPQRDIALSPVDPDQLVVANGHGVWRSVDGGLSWTGLNQSLPNLAVRRILSLPNAMVGIRISAEELGPLELLPGPRRNWQPATGSDLENEIKTRRAYSEKLGVEITAIAGGADVVYAGAADGRIWISIDKGRSWAPSRTTTGAPIEAFFVDAQEPRVALAAVGGSGAHVLRTTNTGGFWDDLTANLPDVPVHGVSADRRAGIIYAATERGVFSTHADLDNPAPRSGWVSVNGNLPESPATDVKLDSTGHRLYVALDGYGVYATPAPHRFQTARLVNAADLSTRPAAPGSLLSVLGARVSSARAGALDFPVLAASSDQSQIQVPFEVKGSSIALAVEASMGRLSFGLPVQATSPAIFIDSEGAPMVLEAETGLLLDSANAARANARIQVLATGLGRVRPDWPTAVPAPLKNPPTVAATVRAYLGRVPIEVTRATLAPGYIGFYLLELQLPAIVNAGPAELYLTADEQESNHVRIYLEP